MALGSGTFTVQNKVLPGTYINISGNYGAPSSPLDRGAVAAPLSIGWGSDAGVIEVTAEDVRSRALSLLGYSWAAPELRDLRELFASCRIAYLYRVDADGAAKATCPYGTAKWPGSRGNALKVIVSANEAYTTDDPVVDVVVLLDTATVFEQLGVVAVSELEENSFIDWQEFAALDLTAGTPLTGGIDGTVTAGSYQSFLDAVETYSFDATGLPSDDADAKALFAIWTKRMREEHGRRFCCVLYDYAADYEGIINLTSSPIGSNPAGLVWWTVGATASCGLSESLTNATYTGEYEVDGSLTQTQLSQALLAGKFVLHRVGESVHVLDDINSLVTYTASKPRDFSRNQTVRVIDAIAATISAMFADRYIGKIPNDESGRVSLWNDVVTVHQELATMRAIEGFAPDYIVVAAGSNKHAVTITERVTPVSAMTQLYLTIVVE